jgi:hypothetical protein
MLRFAPLLIAASGCTEDKEPSIEGALETLDVTAPARVEVGSAVGRDRVAIPVTVVNELGVAVRGTTVDLSVSGACADGTAVVLEESSIAIDASGHGLAHAIAPCSTVFTVQATASGDGATIGGTVEGWALANAAPTFAMGTAAVLPDEAAHPSFVAAGTGGVALGVGSEIWWQGEHSQPPFRVATFASPIAGMREANVDADGVRDLVAWGGSVVVLLRGVAGGYTWEDGFQIPDDRTIAAVAAQDLDGDRLIDLAIASSSDSDGSVEILTGDGAWHWTTTDVLDTSFPIAGVAAGDDEGDGRADLTVIDADRGWLRRRTQSDDGWVEGAPPELINPTGEDEPYAAPAGSVLLPMADLDGDGRQDVIVNEAPDSGSQELVFFVLGAERVTYYHESYGSYFANVADMNQDGAADLLAHEDDVLHIIRHDLATDDFTSQGVVGVGAAAPLAATDLDGDTIADLAIVSDDAAFYRGELTTDDAGALWHVEESDTTSFQVGLTGPHAIADTTGDGLADVVGFTTSCAGATILRNWTITQKNGALAMSTIGTTVSFDLGGDVIPYDLVHCGDSYYGLAGVADLAELVRVVANSGLVRAATQRVDGMTMLACGPLGSASVIAANEDGAWTSYDEALAVIDSGKNDPSDAVAVADVDGDGTSLVVTCGAAPCDIAVADIDGDGLDEIVRSTSTGLSIEGWGETRELPGTGRLSTADVDGDGFVDVLVSDPLTGRVLVFRGLKGGVAPPLAYHSEDTLTGPVDVFDTTGDGVPELLFPGDSGRLTITAASTLAKG